MSRPPATPNITHSELVALLEEDDEEFEGDVVITPPDNAAGEISDEDSGGEEIFSINNLPGSMLRARAEILSDGASSDDETEERSCTSKPKRRRVFSWKKVDISSDSTRNSWKDLSSCSRELSPVEWFYQMFDNNVLELILQKTNNFALAKNAQGDITMEEMKCFIGILLVSGYSSVSRRRMYWESSSDSHNEMISSAMPRDRFDYIFKYIHLNDFEDLDKSDKFTKLRPLFNILNQNFLNFAPVQENYSVDESMVPYFGKHGTKQFIKGKPIRFGYKLWVGATPLGYILWFEPYQGKDTKISQQYAHLGLGASVVLSFCDVLETLELNLPFHIFTDNFFTGLPLLSEMSNRSLRLTGTIRENRTMKCPLLPAKEMKKKDRGFFDYRVSDDIIICRWNDNNVINIASNCSGIYPTSTASRFSRNQKGKISIDQPQLLKLYNNNMGGVDRADQNIADYRINIRGKKWYTPLFMHCIDMAEQNAHQLYKLNGGTLDHLAFRRRVAMALITSNRKTIHKNRSGKPSSSENIDSRYDRLDHLVVPQEKRTRCRVCHKKTSTRCIKCDVGLCINHFVDYHTKSN